jgi:hypothetical protein
VTGPAQPHPKRTTAELLTLIYLAFSAAAITALIIITAVLVANYGRVLAAQHASDITQCQIANNTRQQDIAIWNRLLNVSPAPPSAAARAEIAELQRLVAVKDTPRNCAAAYNTN